MRIEYYGPKPVKTVTRFWGREYRFAPVCEVLDEDGKVLLAECGDIFRLSCSEKMQTGTGPAPGETQLDAASPLRKGVYRGRRASRRQENAES